MLTLKRTAVALATVLVLSFSPTETSAKESSKEKSTDPVLEKVESSRTIKVYNSEFKLVSTYQFESEAQFQKCEKIQHELSKYELVIRDGDNFIYINNK